VRSNTLPPATHTNCFVIGDSPGARIAVDPSPCDDNELERVITALQPLRISEILITHHHGDHNERADHIARRLQVPLRMSRYTEQRLRVGKPGFFEGIQLRHCAAGDRLCEWLGQPVVAIAVPGHDEGQLALAPAGDKPAWCIVGDLIQGIGTVVICPPEGDMLKYFDTMEKMIALNPAVILPSHGIAMGSTFRLLATLQHRQRRESVILDHWRNGASEDAMLQAMYSELDPRLMPLARINIQAHLAKLQQQEIINRK